MLTLCLVPIIVTADRGEALLGLGYHAMASRRGSERAVISTPRSLSAAWPPPYGPGTIVMDSGCSLFSALSSWLVSFLFYAPWFLSHLPFSPFRHVRAHQSTIYFGRAKVPSPRDTPPFHALIRHPFLWDSPTGGNPLPTSISFSP